MLNEDGLSLPHFVRPTMLSVESRQDGWLTGPSGESTTCQSPLFVTAPQDNGTFSWEHSQLDRLWDEHKSFKGFHVELDNRPHCVLRGNEVLLTYRENSLRPGASWEARKKKGKKRKKGKKGKKKSIYLSIYPRSRNFHLNPLLWVLCHSSTVWLCQNRLSLLRWEIRKTNKQNTHTHKPERNKLPSYFYFLFLLRAQEDWKPGELNIETLQGFLRLSSPYYLSHLVSFFYLTWASLRIGGPHVIFIPSLLYGAHDGKPPFGSQKNLEFKWSVFREKR